MKSFEILSQWPTWENAEPAKIFASPAWRAPMTISGEAFVLTKAEEAPLDLLHLLITLSDEEFVLGIADSPLFPELHSLWQCRENLPPLILLSLVEKECGILFEALENVLHSPLAVKRLLSSTAKQAAFKPQAFTLTSDDSSAQFTLPIVPQFLDELGYLKFLDPEHPSLREMTLPILVQIAQFALSEEELANLKPGDALLLPEIDEDGNATELTLIIGKKFVIVNNKLGVWKEDDLCHVLSPQDLSLSFGDFCDGNGPATEPVSTLHLVVNDTVRAAGTIGRLGRMHCFEIQEIR